MPAELADSGGPTQELSAASRRGGRVRPVRAPREHGFWVMLGLAIGAGVGLSPSLLGAALAVILTASIVGTAAILGNRIRKNALLQATAALALGGTILPLGMAGGASVLRSLLVAASVSGVFLSTTLAVQALLLKARRRRDAAARARTLSLLIPGVGAVALSLLGRSGPLFAALCVLSLSLAFAYFPPSLKRLKTVGLVVASVQLAAVLALVL